MDSLLTILSALVMTITSFIIAIWEVRRSIRLKDEDLVFWGCSLFFVIIPILIDSSLILGGRFELFNRMLNEESPNYWTGADADIIFVAAWFTFLFNNIFIITSRIIKSKIRIVNSQEVSHDVYNFIGNSFLLFISAISCISLIIEGANFLINQSENIEPSQFTKYIGLLLPLGAVCIYRTFLSKKYLWLFLYLLPILMLSFLSQARAIFFYIPSALMMAYMFKKNAKVSFPRLVAIGLILLVMAQAIKIVSNEHHGFWTKEDVILSTAVSMFRDSSIGDFYYSIYLQENHPALGTEGSSTLALVSTGIIPPFLAKDLFDPSNTVIYRIYKLRFGNVDYGSMHPTLYGNAYFDLGSFGLLLAVFIPIVLRIYKALLYKVPFAHSIAPVMIANFYFVSLRGSINVAYFRLIYSGGFILFVMAIAYLLQKIFTGRSDRIFHLKRNRGRANAII